LSFAACVLRMPRAAPVRLPSQPTRRARVAGGRLWPFTLFHSRQAAAKWHEAPEARPATIIARIQSGAHNPWRDLDEAAATENRAHATHEFRGPNAGMASSIRGACKSGAFRGGGPRTENGATAATFAAPRGARGDLSDLSEQARRRRSLPEFKWRAQPVERPR
jgi:hypothetical protein